MNPKESVFYEAASSAKADMAPQLIEVAGGRIAVCSVANPESESKNEDCVAVVSSPSGHTVLVVADGVGSSRQGHMASRIAVDFIVRAVLNAPPALPHLRPQIVDAIEHADEAIRNLGTGAATTLAVAEIFEGQLRTYHCGDSTILVCGSQGRIRRMTVGHNPTDMAVNAGWMEPEEALSHNERHLVSNILGSQPLRIEIGQRMTLSPRDTVLVASDGLFDNLVPDEIVEMIRKEPILRNFTRLVDETQSRMTAEAASGKPDDLSVIAWKRGNHAA